MSRRHRLFLGQQWLVYELNGVCQQSVSLCAIVLCVCAWRGVCSSVARVVSGQAAGCGRVTGRHVRRERQYKQSSGYAPTRWSSYTPPFPTAQSVRAKAVLECERNEGVGKHTKRKVQRGGGWKEKLLWGQESTGIEPVTCVN